MRWLDDWRPWIRFVTLATNEPSIGVRRARDLLKQWDARMNRKLVGAQWHKRRDERIWAFYFLEKPGTNPHWHALVRPMTWYPGLAEAQAAKMDEFAEPIWKKIWPAGTVDVQPVHNDLGVEKYVAKTLHHPVSFEYFVTPDEFV